MKKNVLTFPTPSPTIDALLRSAIAGKRLIEFTYKEKPRLAEPHDYGQRHGIDQLLVYQRKKAGNHKAGWRSLDVSKIQALVVLDDSFAGTRGRPHQDHLAWDVLYARVDSR